MRVAIVANSLGRGGAERQAVLWAGALAERGHDVVLAPFERVAREYRTAPAVEVRHLEKAGRLDPRLIRRVRALAGEVDALVAVQPYPAVVVALSGTRTPWLLRTGTDPRLWSVYSGVPSRVVRLAFRRAAAACAPSRGLAEYHAEHGIAARGPWLTIPNIVDERAFVEGAAERQGALFVGRLAAQKDPLMALEAARAAEVPLTVLGEGPLREEVERAGGAVRILPFTPEPWAEFARHRVLVLTSEYEPFGLVVLESLAAGTPVVAVDCDFGPREILAGASFSAVVPREAPAVARALAAVDARPHGAAEDEECRRIAGGYRAASVGPLIEDALTRIVSEG